MKELSKKKYVTLITIMILVLGIIGIVNIGNVDLNYSNLSTNFKFSNNLF